MIDRRRTKTFGHELEQELLNVTDTSILINFSDALTSLYPHLVPIHAFAYDAWDDIVIPLFYEMVYESFSFKYGITITPSEVHPYMYTLPCYRGLHHIECTLNKPNIEGFINFEWINVEKQDLENYLIIYKSFGDGYNFLTGGITKEQASEVHFNLVEVEVVSVETGCKVDGNKYKTMFIRKEDLDFEFVAEEKK
ncbi:hypothetical protein GC093_15340 [Paenibacillus sp. LMG 31456]|uniref:Uncharacterized protein n=1 Tax=Paenibacillus foliorum TaxID=2654974 RepID=A0A972K253_9BACL|nr:hypothetical protein [Paenibacillus foliorum]NOU94583.1 hypothetical protein [Paenibacillus foliorum]